MELTVLQQILRTVATVMKYPVIAILIIFIAFAIFCIGWLVVEMITERRHMRYSLPRILDDLKENSNRLEQRILVSGLLARQKEALVELTRHPSFDEEMLGSLADNIIEREQAHYNRILSFTSLVSKLAPMTGLLGTLIPLGPGIIALGQGDTFTLSSSMLTAFDTTIAGLLAAAVAMVVSAVRRSWYRDYNASLEALAQCVLDRCGKEQP